MVYIIFWKIFSVPRLLLERLRLQERCRTLYLRQGDVSYIFISFTWKHVFHNLRRDIPQNVKFHRTVLTAPSREQLPQSSFDRKNSLVLWSWCWLSVQSSNKYSVEIIFIIPKSDRCHPFHSLTEQVILLRLLLCDSGWWGFSTNWWSYLDNFAQMVW